MIKNILFYLSYAFISSFGLYKLKLSNMLISWNLVIGGIFYVLGFLLWLIILKNNSLSEAFPLASSFLIIATQIFGFFLLKEDISLNKIIGLIFIILGIVIIFKFSK